MGRVFFLNEQECTEQQCAMIDIRFGIGIKKNIKGVDIRLTQRIPLFGKRSINSVFSSIPNKVSISKCELFKKFCECQILRAQRLIHGRLQNINHLLVFAAHIVHKDAMRFFVIFRKHEFFVVWNKKDGQKVLLRVCQFIMSPFKKFIRNPKW